MPRQEHGRAAECRVCGEPRPVPFLLRPAVPVHQNLLLPTAAAARTVARGVLDLRACGRCGFVCNAAFEPGLLDYGPAYENSQDCSPAFSAYLGRLVDHLVGQRGVRDGRVVEVGCGKGAFLVKLLTHPDNRSEGVGFDPSYLVATDGIMADMAGRPGARAEWAWDNPPEAARDFAARDPRFRLEEPAFAFNEGKITERVTYWPSAFLRRVA